MVILQILNADFQCMCEELTLETQTTHKQLLRHKYVFKFCLFIYFSHCKRHDKNMAVLKSSHTVNLVLQFWFCLWP